jgi:hypothetical protein
MFRPALEFIAQATVHVKALHRGFSQRVAEQQMRKARFENEMNRGIYAHPSGTDDERRSAR